MQLRSMKPISLPGKTIPGDSIPEEGAAVADGTGTAPGSHTKQ